MYVGMIYPTIRDVPFLGFYKAHLDVTRCQLSRVNHPIGMSAGEKHTILLENHSKPGIPKSWCTRCHRLDTQKKMLFSSNRSVRLLLPILISD